MADLTRREVLGVAAAASAAIAVTGSSHAQRPPSRMVELPAAPTALTLDTAKTAVIVVDMQNDFGSRGGMFDRAGIDISGIQHAISTTAKALAAARRAGVKIVYLKMAYRPDLSDLGAPESANRLRHLQLGVGQAVHAPDGTPSRILIRDTWNSDIVAELKPRPEDLVIYDASLLAVETLLGWTSSSERFEAAVA